MPITFRPPPAINLNDMCAYIAACVYMPADDLNE